MGKLTVGQLKELLKDFPDDLEVGAYEGEAYGITIGMETNGAIRAFIDVSNGNVEHYDKVKKEN